MFLVATVHLGKPLVDSSYSTVERPHLIAVDLIRLLRGFILRVQPLGPLAYIFDFRRWENLTMLAVTAVMVWLGDILVVRNHSD